MDLDSIRNDDSLLRVQEINEEVRHQFYWLAEEVARLQEMERVVQLILSDVKNAGGEVSDACTPEDKSKSFYNGAWWAAHNIAKATAAKEPKAG